MKRFLVVTGVVVGVIILMIVLISVGYEPSDTNENHQATTGCLHDQRDFLAAQSVPSAQYVPCFTERAVGWNVVTQTFSNDGSHIEMTTDAIQDVDWKLDFTSTCTPPATDPIDKAGNPAEVRQRTVSVPDIEGVERTEWMTFTGGCVVSTVTVPVRIDEQSIFDEIDDLIRLVRRSVLNEHILKETDGKVPLDPSSSAAPTATSVPTGSAPGTTPGSTTGTTSRSGRRTTTTPPDTGPDETDAPDPDTDDTGG